MSFTRRRGLSELMGSWKIICMRVRRLRSAAPFCFVSSTPSSSIEPLVGSTMRMSALPVVDLPHPDSPTSPSVSPSKMSKLTPATALSRRWWDSEGDREVANLEQRRHVVAHAGTPSLTGRGFQQAKA